MGGYESGFASKLQLKDGALPTILADSEAQTTTVQQPQMPTDPQHRHVELQAECAPTVSRAVQFSPYMVSVGTNMATYPFTKCVATQLSYSTLKAKVRSKGTQTRPSGQNTGTQMVQLNKGLQSSLTPARGFAPGVGPSKKRACLECEESDDDDDDDDDDEGEETTVPHDNM